MFSAIGMSHWHHMMALNFKSVVNDQDNWEELVTDNWFKIQHHLSSCGVNVKEVCNGGVACSLLKLVGSWQATPSITKFLSQCGIRIMCMPILASISSCAIYIILTFFSWSEAMGTSTWSSPDHPLLVATCSRALVVPRAHIHHRRYCRAYAKRKQTFQRHWQNLENDHGNGGEQSQCPIHYRV